MGDGFSFRFVFYFFYFCFFYLLGFPERMLLSFFVFFQGSKFRVEEVSVQLNLAGICFKF
jgi:hypothetical protein